MERLKGYTTLPFHSTLRVLHLQVESATSKTIIVDGKEITISASFGYALASVDGESVTDLVSVADSRMYKNKQHRIAGFC